MNYEGERFLLKLYRELYNEEEVRHSGTKSDDKFELVNKYMKRLEKSEKVFDGDHSGLEKYMRERYYDRYVIKEEDIPDSYYELQKRIALERGFGHVEYTPELKHEEATRIIEEQKGSLDNWLNYLMKENTAYPMWARYWAFQGMLKLGMYDKEKNSFTRRSKGTTAPFIDLNPEALAYAIETVVLYQNGKEIDDEELKKLVESGNFGKIYSHNLWKIANDEKNKDKTNALEGEWIEFQNGDAAKVASALRGKGTGWCIASESTAASYLSKGELEIYFTKDSQGKNTIPRACIRTENGNIAEVRGINESQNMEPEMVDIVDEKLDEYPDKEEYKKKVRDMKKLTEIYNKAMTNNELSKEEIFFLYEVDSRIKGFGWERDPRIAEIKKKNPLKEKSLALEIVNANADSLLYFDSMLKNDKDVVLAAVKQDGSALKFASRILRNDKEVVLAAVKQYGRALQYASKELKDNKEIALAAVKQDGYAINYLSERLKKDREVVLTAVKQDGYSLRDASEEFMDDREVVLEAVKQDGRALKHASKKLKDDKEVVLTAVKENGHALEYASDNLRNDKDVVFAAIKKIRYALHYMGDKIKNDKRLMLNIIREDGLALEYVGDELKNDKEVVLTAIKKKSEAIKYASEELKNDVDVVLAAIKYNVNYMKQAGDELKGNKEKMLKIVSQEGYALWLASKELQDDREVVLEAVKQNGFAIKFASERLKNDEELIIEALKSEGRSLKDLSEAWKDDKEKVLLAVKQDGRALEYASDRLRDDKDVVLAAVKENGFALQYASKRLKNDEDVVIEAVRYFEETFKYAGDDIKNNKKFMLKLLNDENVGMTFFPLYEIGPTLRKDEDINKTLNHVIFRTKK